MLKDIIDSVIAKFNAHGLNSVYSAFDALPVESKGNDIYSIVGVSEFESSTPIYSLSYIYLPFKTQIEIKITGSKNTSMASLYNYFDTYIQPVINDMADLNCSLKKISVKYDSNIQRLVLAINLSASGMSKFERGNL